MIGDTPEGFAEHLQDAHQMDEEEWRLRGKRGQAENSVSLVAIDTRGRWIGGMGSWIPDPATGPLLVGVYVAPPYRGRGAGVADALLDAVEEWAGARASTLRLTVHEDNPRAQALYTRRGHELTGGSQP